LFHTWQSKYSTWDSTATTLSNIDVFIDVWQKVQKAGRLWKHEWTVKTDPDCLIVPQRLKWHLGALQAPVGQPVYVKNNAMNSSYSNGGFLGAVEVFSREALELYFDWWPMCEKTIGITGGEDGFMKGCMDALGAGYMVDGGMFKPDDDPRLCALGKYAAYHPMKVQENLQCCIDMANGGTHRVEYGQCKDLDPQWAQNGRIAQRMGLATTPGGPAARFPRVAKRRRPPYTAVPRGSAARIRSLGRGGADGVGTARTSCAQRAARRALMDTRPLRPRPQRPALRRTGELLR